MTSHSPILVAFFAFMYTTVLWAASFTGTAEPLCTYVNEQSVVVDQLRVAGVPVVRNYTRQGADAVARIHPPLQQLLSTADLRPQAGRGSDAAAAVNAVSFTSTPSAVVEDRARSAVQQHALRFTENRGQIADSKGHPRPDILYTADANGAHLYFRRDGVSYVFSKHEEGEHGAEGDLIGRKPGASDRMRGPRQKAHMVGRDGLGRVTTYRMDMHLVGARSDVRVRADGETEGAENYYLAHCPDGVLGVRSFSRVVYENVYDHIDLEYLAQDGRMKYNFIVHPGGDVKDIRMRYQGATSMALDDTGSLRIETPLGTIEEAAPVTYQHSMDTDRSMATEAVASTYDLHEHDITFTIASYDLTRTLIIDPWATYYGGSGEDVADGVATDGSGNVFITGYTTSTNFPIAGALQSTNAGGADAFVVKLSSSGARLWATYYGGSFADHGYHLAIDNSGNAFITGTTNSTNFPVAGAVQSTFAGVWDAFILKLSSSGARVWATYYGGSSDDGGDGIATDNSGNIVITGWTASTNFPVAGAVQPTFAGVLDAFILKLSSSGARLWATFYGGGDGDVARGVSTDGIGNIYVTGATASTDIPLSGAIQSMNAGGHDAFIAKFDASGSQLWATYYGGSSQDDALGIATDGTGDVVIVGHTESSNLTMSGAFQNTNAGGVDFFIVKMSASGTLRWATYLGGTLDETWWITGACIATDASGNVIIAGYSESTDFPVAAPYQDRHAGGHTDAIIAKFTSSGSCLWATYYGGSGVDDAVDIATDGSGNVIITGRTNSPNLPTSNPWQSTFGGGISDAYVAHLSSNGKLTTCTTSPVPKLAGLDVVCAGASSGNYTTDAGMRNYVWTVSSGGTITAGGTGTSNTATITWSTAGSQHVTVNYTDGNGCTAVTATRMNVTVLPAPIMDAQPDRTLCAGVPTSAITFSGLISGTTFAWSNDTPAIGLPTNGIGDVPSFIPKNTGTNPIIALITVTPQVTNGSTTCPGTPETIRLTIQPAPSLTIAGDTVVCNSDRTVLSVEPGPYTEVRWSTGETTASITVRQSGEYVATVTNDAGCTTSRSVQVRFAPVLAPTIRTTATLPTVLCGDGPIDLYLPDAYAQVRWYRENLQTPVGADSRLRVSQPGRFIVEVTDGIGGCTGYDTVSITSSTIMLTPLTGIDPIICRGDSVQVGIRVFGGHAPFAFSWQPMLGLRSPSDSITLARPSVTTRYIVEVRDAAGCVRYDTVTVHVRSSGPAEVTADPDSFFCAGSPVTLRASSRGAQAYQWIWNGMHLTGATSASWTADVPGSYRVVIRDSAGCVDTSRVMLVTLRASPQARAGADVAICAGDSVRIGGVAQGGQPPYRYAWMLAGGQTGPETASILVRPDTTTAFIVQVTDAAGCGSTDTVLVLVSPTPVARIQGATSVCPLSMSTYEAVNGDGVRYTWSVTGGTVTTGLGTATISVRWGAAGSGRVVLSTQVGACTQTDTLGVVISASLSPRITLQGMPTLCPGDSVRLCAPTGYTSYQWSDGTTSPCLLVRTGGVYTVTVQDTNGCAGTTDPVTITQSVPPDPRITATSLRFCPGDSVVLQTTKPYATYRWTTGDTTSRLVVRTSLSVGVTVTDGAGCTGVAVPVSIIEAAPPQVHITGMGSACVGQTATYTAAADTSLSYIWHVNPAFGQVLAGAGTSRLIVHWSTAGTTMLHVIVTDTLTGCSTRDSMIVEVQTVLIPTIQASALVACADGSITLCAPEGYTSYRWFPIDDSSSCVRIGPQAPGVYGYRVTVSAGTSCTGTSDEVQLTFLTPPAPVVVPAGPTAFCAGDSVLLDAGGETYSYLWLRAGVPTGDTARTLTVRQAGSYAVRVRDHLGCTGTAPEVHIDVYEPPIPVITRNGLGLESTSAETYQWYCNDTLLVGQTDRVLQVVTQGWYRVAVRDVNGCTGLSAPYQVTSPSVTTVFALACPVSVPAIPGSIVSLPIQLASSSGLDAHRARTYGASIRFNPSVLIPQFPVIAAYGMQQERTVTVTGTRPGSMTNGTLLTLPFLVVLGDDSSARVTIDSVWWDDGGVEAAVARTECTIDIDLCDAGGVRLYRSTELLQLQPNHPNPFNAQTEFAYTLVEEAHTELRVLDMLGRTVAVLVSQVVRPGTYRAVFDGSMHPSGHYIVLLQTPNNRAVQWIQMLK